ncbi:hypothetical protein [Flavobacterium columnare]|uniref:Phage protein D n=1 Tax=Flavobacterium columnare TaxID=996 RepID=A0AAI8GAB0_9FLAO|nr:hypothetical protein [Flavobacterium columnare]AMO19228.1 hypothetical protein UN65_01630 [Flavobacterium columnare]QOG56179.1 hypothetical protein HUE29_01645 [Flavobacterium columnare]QOG58902.1 hypothetical protein HUE30_01645 [Flavobacterium columnare]QOG61624.1 hypothetical protein HUE31_01650 [Flavobacterium columnare]QOG64346.1 hypothetical protein HUE32_01650 [Flavobacterium columnare]
MNYLYHDISIRITIANNLQFTVCQSIKIESTVQALTDTAKIELPREFRNAVDAVGKTINIAGKSILDLMKRGDSVKIELGYDKNLETEFEGYVTKIGAEMPLLLECEDEMFQLKKAPRVTKFIKSGKLIDILKAVLPSKYQIECNGDYSIGKWLIEDATPYNVLEELREKAGIRAYFKNPTTLAVGMVVDFKAEKVHKFNFSENVRRGSNLKFEQKESKPIFLTVESKQANGTVLKLSKGEKGGDEKTVKLWPNMTKSELEVWANKQQTSVSYDGFDGTLDGWCYPRTKPGHAAQLYRPFYKDRHQDGRYFIESVTIDVNGTDGIKRANTLSYKL